jgi:predicted aspartyl protease
MHFLQKMRCFLAAIILLANISRCSGAVTLNALGLYLTKNGYGGAQLIHPGNFYHLPIQSNGNPGNLIIDTGAPASLIFRPSLKRLALSESKTTKRVSGAFGRSREFFGLTTIGVLKAGNCTLTNVPVTVANGSGNTVFSHANPNGLLGLRELITFGAVLDLPNRLVYLRPSRPGHDVGAGIKSMLLRQNYTPVPFSLADLHLRIAGAVNGVPCHFLVDTGGYLTALDVSFASQAKIHIIPTHLTAEGLGGSSTVGMGILPSLRIGDYELKRASVSVVNFDPDILHRGTNSEVAGLIGVEYLATNCAIFDFITSTMYLRPRSR